MRCVAYRDPFQLVWGEWTQTSRRGSAAVQSRRSQENKEVRSRPDVVKDDALEIAARNPGEIKEDIVLMLSQILEDRQRLRHVGPAITDENSSLDPPHNELTGMLRTECPIIYGSGPVSSSGPCTIVCQESAQSAQILFRFVATPPRKRKP
jgi:hypothetical protein